MSFLVLFIFSFFLVGYVFYVRSGWKELAKQYKTKKVFEGHLASGVSACFNKSEYFNGIIVLGKNDKYLYLSHVYFIRLFYPALLIPLDEVVFSTVSFPKLFRAKFSFKSYPHISFRVSKRTVSKLGIEI